MAPRLGYLAQRLLRRHTPPWIFFKLLTWSGRGNLAEDRPDELFEALQERLRVVPVELAGSRVLEIGSGRYARLAVRILGAGAGSVTLVDPHATALESPAHREVLEQDCGRLDVDADSAISRIRLVTGDLLATPVPAREERADLVFSTATLEHVEDPAAILSQSWKWLKPGGFVSHVIDLRDHLFGDPFEMLTYSDRVWSRWLDPKGAFHLNRWRLPDYLRGMREAGFIGIDYEVMQEDRAGLLRVWHRLDERFRRFDKDLLSVTVVHLHARKPNG